MGRNGIPVELKELTGTSNKTRERRKSEPRYPVVHESFSVAPNDLSEEAKEIWGRVALQLHSTGLFFPSVYEYLHSYCRAYIHAQGALKYLEEYGILKDDEKGQVVNPALKVYNDAVTQMILIGGKLGLSPVDKSKISISTFKNNNIDKNNQKVPFNGQ